MKEEIKTLIAEAVAMAEATGDSQLVMRVLDMYKIILDLTAEIFELKRTFKKILKTQEHEEECDGKVIIEISGEEIAEAIHERIQRKIDESTK